MIYPTRDFHILTVKRPCLAQHTGLQKRIRNVVPFSIKINCRCHHLALCFKHLLDQLSWLESIDRQKGLQTCLVEWLLLFCKKPSHFKSFQEAYGLKALNLVKAAVTRWISHRAHANVVEKNFLLLLRPQIL